MGEVKRILAQWMMESLPLFHDDLRIEEAEAVHVHWRDCRILMSPEQFEAFAVGVSNAESKWEGGISPRSDIVLDNSKLPGESAFARRVVIEEQRNGSIHFHYRDLRLEISVADFVRLSSVFAEARLVLIGKPEKKMLKLDEIDPYDHIHFATREEWVNRECEYPKDVLAIDYANHQQRTKEIIAGLKTGLQIRPIIVTPGSPKGDKAYWRRDGFCRYEAYQAMGWIVIPAYVVSEELARTQPQHGLSPFRGSDERILL